MGAWRVGVCRSGGGGSEMGDHKRTTRSRGRWAAGRVTGGDKPDVGEGEAGVRVRQTGEEIKGRGSAT